MTSTTIALLVALLTFAVFAYLLIRKINQLEEKTKPDETLTAWLKTMQTTVEETNRNLNQAMRESNQAMVENLQKTSQGMNERLDKAAEFIAGVKKEVGQMAEIGRGMKDLQEFLRSPKLRGNIGEMVLKEILGQMLPKKAFFLQYTFKSGETVDAAVQTQAGIIPVDSKFPMESFRRLMSAEGEKEKEAARHDFANDVKKHIRAISSKYILPAEGTIDYALMYLPSEAVYYEVANDPQLFDYAGKNRVLPVSASTFYAYLKAILASFEGQKIEAKARQILASLRAIEKDYQKVDERLGVLNRHLTNAYNQMGSVNYDFSALGQRLNQTRALGEESEAEEKEQQMGINAKIKKS